MTALIPFGHRQFTDSNGDPLVGGTVGYYEVNGTAQTLKPVWADEAQTVQLTNPVPLNAAGRPFSGGHETAVWGDGNYTEVVKDRWGATVYTAIVETPFSSAGGTIHGDVAITGRLDVFGPRIWTAGDLDAGGNLSVTGSGGVGGNFGVGADLGVNGNAGINGSLNINGNLGVNGSTGLQAVSATDLALSGPITGATSINGGWPKMLGGVAMTGSDGVVGVLMSPPFNAVASVVCTLVGPPGAVADTGPVMISINYLTNSSFVAYTEIANIPSTPATAQTGGTGTGASGGDPGNGGGPGAAGGLSAAADTAGVQPFAASVPVSMYFTWIAIGA